MHEKEYIIFCDESVKKGDYYSNFYGGVLVGTSQYDRITAKLNTRKAELNLYREVKWQKVSKRYLEHYKKLMETFFEEIVAGNLKVRIMFTQNAIVPNNLSQAHKDLEYFILYYQFIKHGFGLQSIEHDRPEVFLRLYFDKMPDTEERVSQFKGYLHGLQKTKHFDGAKIRIRESDIAEVSSHDHALLQCLDVVLGSMAFRLNDKHKAKPDGKRVRGNRTIAKERLYKYILSQICRTRPNFNIGISTGKDSGLNSLWADSYRHWRFIPKNSNFDDTKTKRQ